MARHSCELLRSILSDGAIGETCFRNWNLEFQGAHTADLFEHVLHLFNEPTELKFRLQGQVHEKTIVTVVHGLEWAPPIAERPGALYAVTVGEGAEPT